MRSLLLLPFLVLAVPGVSTAHEAAPAPVTFTYSKEAFQPWSIDTGWLPETGGAVQVRFIGHVGGGMACRAGGSVYLEWPAPRLSVQGDVGAGQLAMDMGVELETFLRLDLQIPYGPRFTWEGPIPLVPGFDYRFAGTEAFTPFLLPGQQPAEVTVSDSIQQTTLYELSLTDQIVPIPGVEGSIEVSAGGLLDLVLRGLGVGFPEGSIESHGAVLPVQFPPGGLYQTVARYDAGATYRGTLLLQPAVVISLGPLEWDLARFDVPVQLPPVTETWAFTEQPAAFGLPRLEATVVESGARLQHGTSLDLGASRERTVRLANVGQADLSGEVVVSGEGFSAGGPGTVALLPGQSVDLPVRYSGNPGSSGAAGQLTLGTSDPAGPVAVGLTVQGTRPPPDAGWPDAGSQDAGSPDAGTTDPPLDLPPGCGCAGAGGAAPLALLGLLAGRRRRRRRDLAT